MNKKSMWLVRSLMAVFLILTLVACSSSSGGATGDSDGTSGKDKVELTMTAWGNPEEIKVYQKAIDAFEEENPDITVDLIPGPGDTYKQKLLTQLQGSQAPDVFYVGGEYISQLISTGKIANLTEFLNSSESYVKPDEFVEGLWGPSRVDGEIYGTPVDSNPMLIYYNKKILEEAGLDPNEPQKLYEAGEWTWDKFAELNEKITASGKHGFLAGNAASHLFSWIWTNDGKMYDDKGNIILDENEKAQEAIKYLNENIDAGNFTYTGSLPKGQGEDAMFLSNQTGFVAAGRWFTPLFSQNESLEFDYIPWPTNNGEKIATAAVATAYMSATNSSKHLEEALKFISFYTSEAGQEARLSGNGNAIPSVTGLDDLINDAEIPEHANYLVKARDIGKVEDNQSVVPGLDGEITDILDLMFLGELSTEEAITEIVNTAEPMIEEYKNQ